MVAAHTPAGLCALGLRIADAAVRTDIECHALQTACGLGQRWWDTSSMLDTREHAPEVIDMFTQALHYADARGLIRRHGFWRHLVQFKEPCA